MAGLLDWLSKQKDSAMSDYAGLMDNYPNAQKFGSGLMNNISQHIPTQADYQSPQSMFDFGMSVAPMGLSIKNPNKININVDDYYHPLGAGTKLKSLDMSSVRVPNTEMIPRRTISPEEIYRDGSTLVPATGDRTDAGSLLTHVNDKQLPEPVQLEGGEGFMRTTPGSIWASDTGIISGLANKINPALERGDNVYMPTVAMGHAGGDYSTMMSDTLFEQMLGGKILKRDIKAFDKNLQSFRPEWKGLFNEESRNQLMANGALRHAFIKSVSGKDMVSKGFPELASTRAAIIDPNQLDIPMHGSGYSIGKVNPNQVILDNVTKPHATYNTQIGGNYAGGLIKTVPRDIMFPDFYKMRREMGTPVSGDVRSFALSNPSQKANQEWLDGIMRHIQGAN